MKEGDPVKKTLPRTQEELAEKYARYGPMLYRVCLVNLCSRQDAEDAVQDTFASYLQKCPEFRSAEHEKAWFLRVAINRCRDKRREAFFRRTVCLDEIGEYAETPEEFGLLEELAALPPRCKSVLVLHYVEGYKVGEIAPILGIRENAVKAALFRGRNLLRLRLKEESLQWRNGN